MNASPLASWLSLLTTAWLLGAHARAAQAPAPMELIECGALVDSGDIAPGAQKSYSLQADVGDKIYLHYEGLGSGYVLLKIQDPLGGFWSFHVKHDNYSVLLSPPSSGVHLVTLTNVQNLPGRVNFRMDWMAPGAKQCGTSIECNSSELGAASYPFPKNYRFQGSAGDTVVLSTSPITNTYGLHPVLYSPSGSVTEIYANNNPTTLPTDGSYTILVWDGYDNIPDDYCTFRLDLDWIAPAERQCGQRLQCGDYATGELLSDWDSDIYFFEGNAGDKFHIETSNDDGEAGFNAQVYVTDAAGDAMPISGYDRTVTLSSTGTCMIRIANHAGGTPHVGKYRLRLRQVWPGQDTCAPILECGVPMRGSTLWKRGAEFFAFDAEVGDRVRLEVTKGPGRDPAWSGTGEWTGPQLTVYDPDFRSVSFSFSLANNITRAGRYTLKVADSDFRGHTSGAFTVTARWEEPAFKRCDTVCPPPGPSNCSGVTIRAIDFNEPGFRAAPSDPLVLLAGGRDIEGAATDGVTPVLLVAEGLSGPSPVTFALANECSGSAPASVGSLHDPLTGTSRSPLVVAAIQDPVSGQWKACAVWTTPDDFSSGASDRGAAFRTVRVNASAGATCGFRDLVLVRPPVLLVHGLWGSGDAWDFRTLPARNAARYLMGGRTMPEYVYVHDYRLTHAAPIADNVAPLRRAIDSTLRSFRGLDPFEDVPLACTQVDLVAHSMGAVISRRFVTNASGDYLREENFLRGDIHKFIPIGGPHFGSPLADAIAAVLRIPGLNTLLAGASELFGMCLDCGAVEDLQLDELDSTPEARVRSHAIYGTGASDYIQAGTLVPPRVFSDEVTGAVSILAAIRRSTALDLSGALFGDEPHDMLVSQSVARSGLPDSKVTGFGFVDGVHTYLHKSWRVESRVTELLNAPLLQPGSPFAPTLPGASSLPFRSAGSSSTGGGSVGFGQPSYAVLEGALRLTSPMLNGLKAGDAIAVEIFPVTGFQPDGVVVFGGAGFLEILDKPPFQTVVQIPSTAETLHGLFAIGWSRNAIGVSGQLTLRLDASAVPERLHVTPAPLFLLSYEPCGQLAVQARYSDYSVRDVDPDEEGLSFQSLNPSIATVDGLGRVCGHSDGKTSMLVTYNGRSAEVPIVVDLTAVDGQRALAVRRQCGSNPGGFDVTGPHGGRPVTGSSVTLEVMPSSLGYTMGTILGHAAGDQRLLPSGQTLCLDLASARLFTLPVSNAASSVTLSIPNLSALIGRTFAVQAAVFAPSAPGVPSSLLLNSWDFRIGAR